MSQLSMFDDSVGGMSAGAHFSKCRQYRYSLWRVWDNNLPLAMVIGLNPSTANGETDDPTIKSVTRICKHNGLGGFYMCNCFPYVSTNPKDMYPHQHDRKQKNDQMLKQVAEECKVVVFAWGTFKVVTDTGRDQELRAMFPDAMCLGTNANGSPKHPLFQSGKTVLQKFQ